MSSSTKLLVRAIKRATRVSDIRIIRAADIRAGRGESAQDFIVIGSPAGTKIDVSAAFIKVAVPDADPEPTPPA